MALIVGLGNPGERYARNRHNVGFMAVDLLMQRLSTTDASKSTFKGDLARSGHLYLLKPKTYMNLSGESVRAVTEYFKLDSVIALHDDIDLPFGALRIKKGGGHGGHNGLRSMDAHIGADYFRVRIGIGRPQHKNEVADYCLSDFSKAEFQQLPDILDIAAQTALALASGKSLSEVTSQFTISAKPKEG